MAAMQLRPSIGSSRLRDIEFSRCTPATKRDECCVPRAQDGRKFYAFATAADLVVKLPSSCVHELTDSGHFVCAVYTHVRASNYSPQFALANGFLLLAVAALVLGLPFSTSGGPS